ncbi:MAG: Superoxide dismutase, Fe-Mn family [Candidatus Uhrbacteria bacterium GW2011_GWF2_41_16]|uniref:superoxide dismutase n=2 Tax=Candidatus Uhriibacteriota TaxID=1752732 RepID=A0A0G0VCA5_9BACT|nr:MAG: Superoxide dismutase, Fe-Mn family [Candidatus Uhrbacteria bacterium GW2011_GWA2_41_10]KKR87593.1 MAG: Superoxide dismutase, Fe-Mn family [Candidatus Uhrbacteria bacterium GW2011_GWC2_41_11]KKR98573.1 MAG: Superoxide dismutase, Fe-Mn family [Candidatus Uhrbacteria bacterium GW2011_GWF2_41_16]HBO99807.1 superoxide dismutase [Candidatus Uhrbacteria bacterium]
MSYEAKSFDHLLGLEGFSDTLLKNHFTLYQGYVKNTNTLLEEKNILEKEEKTNIPSYAELTRRFGWEFNGMRLHEHYFENIKKDGNILDESHRLFRQIEKAFGSFKTWETNFKSVGAMRGIGWVILYQDRETGWLFNTWINEHDVGHLAGCIPLLVMDVFEHAFMIDYGLKRADYIETFFKTIDWNVVQNRFQK